MYRQLLILILMFSKNNSEDPAKDINLKECGTTKTAVKSRIVGGTKVDITTFPWTVSFQKKVYTKSDHFCGGSVINQRWILTAAHCIQGVSHSIQKVRAMVGSTNWNDPKGSSYEVEKAKMHEKYESFNYANDIALIKTKTPIQFKSDNKNIYVNSVCLSTPSINLTETANIYGWGLLGEFEANSKALMKTTLNTFDRNKCNEVYKEYIGKLTKQMMCYSAPGKDACQGDSGGPLSQKILGKETQMGIVSFGLGCGRKENPGIYTNVALYLDWIKKVIKDN